MGDIYSAMDRDIAVAILLVAASAFLAGAVLAAMLVHRLLSRERDEWRALYIASAKLRARDRVERAGALDHHPTSFHAPPLKVTGRRPPGFIRRWALHLRERI